MTWEHQVLVSYYFADLATESKKQLKSYKIIWVSYIRDYTNTHSLVNKNFLTQKRATIIWTQEFHIQKNIILDSWVFRLRKTIYYVFLMKTQEKCKQSFFLFLETKYRFYFCNKTNRFYQMTQDETNKREEKIQFTSMIEHKHNKQTHTHTKYKSIFTIFYPRTQVKCLPYHTGANWK